MRASISSRLIATIMAPGQAGRGAGPLVGAGAPVGKDRFMPEPQITTGMYGPDITFAGVPRTTLDALGQAGLDIVFIGAPFDGGTSDRPGTRLGPQALRGA